MQTKTKVTCLTCQVEFEKAEAEIRRSSPGRNFCSRSCSAKLRRGLQRNPPKPRTCKSCGAEFTCSTSHRSYTFCSPCSGNKEHLLTPHLRLRKRHGSNEYIRVDFRLMTLEEAMNSPYVKGKHRSHIYDFVRRFNRSWNKHLLKLPCLYCGYSKHSELAHIKGIKTFSLDSTLGEINNVSNVLPLCRNCHWEFDNDLLSLETIKLVRPRGFEPL